MVQPTQIALVAAIPSSVTTPSSSAIPIPPTSALSQNSDPQNLASALRTLFGGLPHQTEVGEDDDPLAMFNVDPALLDQADIAAEDL